MPSLARRRIRYLARRIRMSSIVRPRTQKDRNARLLYLSTAMIGAGLANATSTHTALIIAGIIQALTIIPFVLLPKDI